MKPILSELLVAASVFFGALPQERSIHLLDPWIRPGAAGGNSALYVRLHNAGSIPDTLLEATAEVAARVELHQTVSGPGNMRRMEPVSYVVLPARGEFRLEPGGWHVMLLGLKRDLRAGDTVKVELRFARAGRIQLQAPVRPLSRSGQR